MRRVTDLESAAAFRALPRDRLDLTGQRFFSIPMSIDQGTSYETFVKKLERKI